MNAEQDQICPDDAPATTSGDWESAFVSHSADELLKAVAARRDSAAYEHQTKELVSIRYSPEVLAYFRATGAGWQTRIDEVLREYVEQHKSV